MVLITILTHVLHRTDVYFDTSEIHNK